MKLSLALLVLWLSAAASHPVASLFGVQVIAAQTQAAPAPAAVRPSSWQAETRAAVRAPFARLLRTIIRLGPRLVATALMLLVFWAIAAGGRHLATNLSHYIRDPTRKYIVAELPYYVIWAIGGVAAIDTLGFDAQSVATGLGLTSIALGFALKDVVSNLVSGLLMLLTRPFAIGDQIIVGETEGTVERLEVRCTHIRTYGGRLVLVPNSEVFTSRVVNNTASPLRRARILVPLDYNQNLQLATRAIGDAMSSTSGVATNPPPLVRLRALTADHLALEARFWTDAHRNDFINTSCAVRAAILHALTDAGVKMPDTSARLLSPGDPERWRAALVESVLLRPAVDSGSSRRRATEETPS